MILHSKIAAQVMVILISVFFTIAFSQNDFEIDNDGGYFKQKFELVNDLVVIPVELNGRPVYRYNLKKITEILSSKEGKKIRLEVMRKGMPIEIEFRLERIL